MTNITDFFTKTDLVKQLISNLGGHSSQLITGLNDTPRSVIIAGVFASTKKNILVLTDNQYHADQIYKDLVSLIPEEKVLEVISEDNLAVELSVSSFESQLSKSIAINQLVNSNPLNAKIIIAPIAFIKQRSAGIDEIKQSKIKFKVGDIVNFQELKNNLFLSRYRKVQMVNKPGEYSNRGSIIDIFPVNDSKPIRIDFFDTQIDSMKYFDYDTQKSLEKIQEATILSASDLIISADKIQEATKQIENDFQKYRDKLEGNNKKKITQGMKTIFHQLETDEIDNQIKIYGEYFFSDISPLNYLNDENILIVDEFAKVIDADKNQTLKNNEFYNELIERFETIPNLHFELSATDQIKKFNFNKIFLSNLQRGFSNQKFDFVQNISSRTIGQFFSQIPALKTELQGYQKRGFTTLLLASNYERAESLQKTLSDFQISIEITRQIVEKQNQIQVSPLLRGFEIPQEKIAVITESELFAKVKTRRPPKRQTFSNAERINSYNELSIGDYVVHINHGIGQYLGLKNIESLGSRQDYLEIAFAAGAKIYVPVTQLNLVQKYIGASDGKPRVSSLTSGDWAKTKRKISAQIEDIADELIELYAQRQLQVGYAFNYDDEKQQKFENDFPYPETDDQLKSVVEIKKDMQSKRPMDRLLVGDVGFGKTEVAMRAAFKAVAEKKQVAFLTPTTILAQQHYQTLIDRFIDFPEIKIAVMSRFATTSENKKTIEKLKKHEIDIVVGTHRLLSKDVEFSDLGLLVIDEEQRFGVKHKEKIKQIRNNVDVLTLTATPIPRTLNMALTGARDLSILETPPANRFPIQTYVLENNWAVVADAIEKEISRNGQVFFVHNKVIDIEHTVAQVQKLVPDARVSYIHGQMAENQVENTLLDFINGEFDVLVTTTIIETGVDIPNANTMIIENAQNFGLSSLYQLRGRIGRSNRLAYAYFLYPPDKQPNEDAQKRLEAIRDFTDLGSGFKLAMRDLSIRGAGDILGKQQHGFINSIGYELFQELLNDAVTKKQGKQKDLKLTNAELVISLQAYLPDEYISDQGQKIEMYQRMRQSKTQEQYQEVENDLKDRFGDYPKEVSNLLLLLKLKNAADIANVVNIRQNKNEFEITFNDDMSQKLAGETIFKTLNNIPYKARVSMKNDKLLLTIFSYDEVEETIKVLTDYLRSIK
ncbi:MAG: transcription-repair coupling factor [Lactobacillaceae bacterium]|jgi:transcription-repair coupling factor (superfamily II helicase)|nr:transcription-repair coupling factor [Lactobacillaceae bacterium]